MIKHNCLKVMRSGIRYIPPSIEIRNDDKMTVIKEIGDYHDFPYPVTYYVYHGEIYIGKITYMIRTDYIDAYKAVWIWHNFIESIFTEDILTLIRNYVSISSLEKCDCHWWYNISMIENGWFYIDDADLYANFYEKIKFETEEYLLDLYIRKSYADNVPHYFNFIYYSILDRYQCYKYFNDELSKGVKVELNLSELSSSDDNI